MAPAPFKRPVFELVTPLAQHDNIRTGPELLAFNAKHNPNHLYCLQATKGNNDSRIGVLKEITFAQMQRSVENAASFLSESLQLSRPYRDQNSGKIIRGAPVALFLGSDIGLMIHLLALLYLGIPVVLLSARLSPVAIAHLLKATTAGSIIASSKGVQAVQEAVDSLDEGVRPIIHEQRPWETFVSETDGQLPPMCPLVDEDDRNVLILHSSGTTGLPKPIHHTHKYLLGYANNHLFPDDGHAPPINLSTLPLYHGFGLLGPSISMATGMPICLPSAATIPTAELVIELLARSGAESLMTVPSILEDLSRMSEGVSALLKLHFVAVGGGPIKPSVGEELAAAGVKLLNHAGATEIGAIAPIFRPGPDYDWHYLLLRKDIGLNLELVPSTEGPERHRLVGFPFGWGTRFEVQDLLECNPLHPHEQFKILGRNDDLIVLANGEKVLPRVLESAISALENVRSAVAFGEGRFELGLIVEPVVPVSEEDAPEFLHGVWPAIVQANALMDEHARVSSKSLVVIATGGKIVPRSDKGSCMRKETYRIFETEIAEAYERLESPEEAVPVLSEHHVVAGLMALLQRCIRSAADLSPCDDFFEQGMDSLQAVRFHRLLTASLKKSSLPVKTVPREYIFRYTTAEKLAKVLSQKVSTNGHSRADRMLSLADAFDFQRSGRGQATVLLTGSTGSLGAFLVEHLSQFPSIERVYCMVRQSASGEHPIKRQQKAFSSRGISLQPEAWEKIQMIETDSSAPGLGLGRSVYRILTRSVTHIIHNAWPMDFNRAVESFEPHFHALHNLLQLASDIHDVRKTVRPRLLFTSSIAAVGMYPAVYGSPIVPEEPMKDPLVTDSFGYAEAKWVCEKILQQSAASYPDAFETTVVRVGQLTGSEKSGVWNSNEHFPALLKSSQLIGALPEVQGTLSWLPVDWAARSLTEILFNPAPFEDVYHLENPVRQPWNEVLNALAPNLKLPAERLPFEEWLEKVQSNDHSENVAKKLTTFFREEFLRMATGEVILDTAKSCKASETLRTIGPVPAEVIGRYVNAWRSKGFLQ